jgi:signal transduction histidine kinase
VSDKSSHLLGEWVISLLRWGLLLGVFVVGYFDPLNRMPLLTLALFAVTVLIFNLVITLLLYLRLFFWAFPVLTLVADVLVVISVVYLSGGSESPLFFAAVFPILIAALRFGWLAGLIATGIFMLSDLFYVVAAWQVAEAPVLLFRVGWHALLYGLVYVVSAVASDRVPVILRAGRWRDRISRETVPDHLRLFYEMASSLSATLNYERVLESILEISRSGFSELGMRMGKSVGLVLLYDERALLAPVSHRNLVTREDEVRWIKGINGIVAEAVASGQAVIGGAAKSDPELQAFDSLQPTKSMICVPLRAGFETYGAVLFASAKQSAYTAEHVELLTLFCNQATIALQNASLYRSLREERDKIVDKEEEARRKLARELHDGPTQDVAAIAMRLNFARLLVERDPRRAKSELERLEDLAHHTVQEIRSMLFTLRPIILETEGLVAALNQYAENLQMNDGLPVTVNAEQYDDCLDMEVQGVVFAILEEAINNARKHSLASRIDVRLATKDELFVAKVEDNGRGFDVQSMESSYGSRGSLGMVNLRERAELIGGTVNIESTPGEGTRITVLVPLSENTA